MLKKVSSLMSAFTKAAADVAKTSMRTLEIATESTLELLQKKFGQPQLAYATSKPVQQNPNRHF